MSQKEYSQYIQNEILKEFPEFIDYCSYEKDNLKIKYPSPNRLVKLWITTQDLELTIGLEGLKPKMDWHTHMSIFGAHKPDEELSEAFYLLKSIMFGYEDIVCSSEFGYYISDGISDSDEYKTNDEIIEIKKWENL